MANTKEKAWRERERESGCFANRYSCSQLLQILQPQVCGYRISNRARISSSTGCKHQPELFVNFSPPIRYPIRTRETDRYVSPRAGWKKTFSSGKIDKLAGHILEWHLISQFDRPVGDVCTVCSFLGRIRAFCRPVKGLTLRKYVDVNVFSCSNRGRVPGDQLNSTLKRMLPSARRHMPGYLTPFPRFILDDTLSGKNCYFHRW